MEAPSTGSPTRAEPGGRLPSESAAFLNTLKPEQISIVGGPAAIDVFTLVTLIEYVYPS